MKLKEVKRTVLRVLGNLLLNFLLDLLCRTLRIKIINEQVIDSLVKQNKNFVFAFWHRTMLVPWFINSNKKFAALTSLSKDGDLLANLLDKWKYQVVRGSSSRGGEDALSNMVEYAKRDYSVAITPDGPRGPIFEFKAGAVITAKRTGIPVVLAGTYYLKKRTLNSWDKMEIPKFFSEVYIKLSEPIYVESDLNYDNTSRIIKECEDQLNKLQKEAEELNKD
ncbi:MAG TPA: lysophospholipid acyltransferase family protein [Ignavibacteriaceae bacterium]|nr:lysophospholipid acyltransferase family protein [Ignavibacteriaceae bacterium]